MNYVIITSVKNEIEFIETTLLSIIGQKIKPAAHFIFDDDSTDGTSAIIDKYSNQFDFIKPIRVKNFRPDLNQAYQRIPANFNYAYSLINIEFDYLLKIDADVQFGPEYISKILDVFTKNPKLGIASGYCSPKSGINVIRDDTNQGPAKFYKKECFIAIGGRLYEQHGHDTMDNVDARYSGWETQRINVEFKHLKGLGSKTNLLKWHYEKGRYKGAIPYFFPYFILTLVKTIFQYPFIISAVFQLFGYLNTRFITGQRWFPYNVSQHLIGEQKYNLFNLQRLLKGNQ